VVVLERSLHVRRGLLAALEVAEHDRGAELEVGVIDPLGIDKHDPRIGIALADLLPASALSANVPETRGPLKAWLFVGSDDHGQAAGNLLTLIASARLHKLDPEVYLRDVFRVLPHWPRDRYLELAPRYWRITRARLDRNELDREVGWLTVPELPLPTMLPSVAFAAPPSPAL
jgi:hypothetical protein